MKESRLLLLAALARGGLPASADTVLFADTFDRGDSSDLNASTAGKSGSLGALNWVEKVLGTSAGNQVTLIVLNTSTLDLEIALQHRGLPVASVTSFRTRQFDISSKAFEQRSVNLGSNLSINKKSITTFVFDLGETLNSYDPELLRVDSIEHHGNQVSLAMPSQPGQEFILWKTSNLATGFWQEVPDAVRTESDGQLILIDPNPGTTSAFYRIQRDTGP